MKQIENIDNSAHQRHIILFEESEIVLTLRYLPVVEEWIFDAEYKDKLATGIRIAVGVPHMVSRGFPFDFAAIDNSGNGLDPFRVNDFSDSRCSLFLLEPDDMLLIRGIGVEL